jgi:hypothetical protein
LTEPPPISSENGTRRYSELEVEILIDDLTEAAMEAIDLAAGEAAKAAVLSMLEREAAACREIQSLQTEINSMRNEAIKMRKDSFSNIIITGLACLVGGFVIGYSINN